MASRSSARGTGSGTKPFDFASDDILSSYEDYGNQDGNNGTHADSSSIAHDSQEFHKSRMSRSSVFPTATYNPPEESSFNQTVVSAVENSVKKYTDNILRFLEGISSRLSQLELYCYNLDKSIGEMRSDLIRDHSESDSKLKSIEKHMHEAINSLLPLLQMQVHRSVQILRDKQELSEAQRELAKLQLAQIESSSSSGKAPQNDDRTSEAKKTDVDSHDQKLALALPHQVAPPPPSHPTPRPLDLQQPPPVPPPTLPPQQVQYYLPAPQLPPPSQQPSQARFQQNQSQMGHPQQSQMNPSPMPSPYHHQQWPPQPPVQPQIRTSSQLVYPPPYLLSSQSNPTPQDLAPVQVPFSSGSEVIPYSYGSSGKPPVQQQQQHQQHQSLAQHLKGGGGYGDGYGIPSGQQRPPPQPGNSYMVFDGETGRTTTTHLQPPPHYQQQGPSYLPPPPATSFAPRGHPYNELIEKLIGMGYRGEHVVGVIQRLEESGQAVDFNSVLDRLNGGGGGGGSQRGWS
ncbi:hypothetical protein M569_12549, partial [Genlisea aurea]